MQCNACIHNAIAFITSIFMLLRCYLIENEHNVTQPQYKGEKWSDKYRVERIMNFIFEISSFYLLFLFSGSSSSSYFHIHSFIHFFPVALYKLLPGGLWIDTLSYRNNLYIWWAERTYSINTHVVFKFIVLFTVWPDRSACAFNAHIKYIYSLYK